MDGPSVRGLGSVVADMPLLVNNGHLASSLIQALLTQNKAASGRDGSFFTVEEAP